MPLFIKTTIPLVSSDVATLTVGMPALARANSAPPSVGDTSLFSVRSLYEYLISKKLSWTVQLTHELQLCKISRFFDHSPRVTHSVIVFKDLDALTICPGHPVYEFRDCGRSAYIW